MRQSLHPAQGGANRSSQRYRTLAGILATKQEHATLAPFPNANVRVVNLTSVSSEAIWCILARFRMLKLRWDD
jgi:hypothetical protein